ncbi:MAG: hypothetical protein ACLU9S_00995 [Oscillospiraceae bacterium]
MNGIKILGMGRSVPAQVVTNDDMARIVDTSDEWITSRTGIRSRHHCRGETHTQLCREAAQRALERAGVRPEEIGACIVATVTAQSLVPSTACLLQRDLGLPQDIPCFDLKRRLHRLSLRPAHHGMPRSTPPPGPTGLVIGAEVLSRFSDFTDRSTCVLFGDGAGAAVVECRAGWPSIAPSWAARETIRSSASRAPGWRSLRSLPWTAGASSGLRWRRCPGA